jgi:hypothetical protein
MLPAINAEKVAADPSLPEIVLDACLSFFLLFWKRVSCLSQVLER